MPSPRTTLIRGLMLLGIALGVGILLWKDRAPSSAETVIPQMAKVQTPSRASFRWQDHAQTPPPKGMVCAECHADIVAQWSPSQHANANRLVKDTPLKPGSSSYGGVESTISVDFLLEQQGLNGFTFEGTPVAVIGVEPLIQPLVEVPGGR